MVPRARTGLVLVLAAAAAAAACGGSRQPAPAPAPAVVPAPRDPSAPPCFPDGPPVVATVMYEQLQHYAAAMFEPTDAAPPRGTFGTCAVEGNQVRDADGLVAELTCGVRVLRPGIVDDLGLQVGARGQAVLDRKPQPVPELRCWANGPDQVGCGFERPADSDTDASWYIVAGTLRDDALVGEAAVAFFAPRILVEIDVSVWCH